MLRRTFALILGLSAVALPLSAQDRPAPPLVPDPDWRPATGDRVIVRQPGIVGLPNRWSCERYARAVEAADAAGTSEAYKVKGSVQIAADTPVLVLEPHGLLAAPSGPAPGPADLNRDIQDAINRAATRPQPVVSIEVRVLDGPHKGRATFVPMGGLARMIPAPATSALKAGDRLVVAARAVPMGDTFDYLAQFLQDPDGGSNRAHVLPLPKGTTVLVQSVDQWSARVKVVGRSRFEGKVGYVKGDGLEPAKKAK